MSGPHGGGVPPAFRGRIPESASFLGLDDDQVLKIGASAYRRHDWSRFDEVMSELAARAQRCILAKLREHGALDENGLPRDDPDED